jgi:hypothetical protein
MAAAIRPARDKILTAAGIAYGWSESTRHAHDATSYLQKFTPRREREYSYGSGVQ